MKLFNSIGKTQNNYTISELAQILGVSNRSVYRVLNNTGINLKCIMVRGKKIQIKGFVDRNELIRLVCTKFFKKYYKKISFQVCLKIPDGNALYGNMPTSLLNIIFATPDDVAIKYRVKVLDVIKAAEVGLLDALKINNKIYIINGGHEQ